jgi:hypothetical protein
MLSQRMSHEGLIMAKTARQLRALCNTAYHEAGHAVVQVVLGLPISEATIKPTAETLGHVKGEPPPDWEDQVLGLGYPDAWNYPEIILRVLN